MKGREQMLLIGKQKAFTLIEVVIGLVLMGLIVGITLPNFNQLLASVDQKAANRQVINLFNELKSKAVTEGQKQSVEIKNNRFIYNPGGEKVVFGRGIKKVKINSGSNPIYFYPNGSCSGAQLLLITNNGHKIKVHLDKITAQTTVEEEK